MVEHKATHGGRPGTIDSSRGGAFDPVGSAEAAMEARTLGRTGLKVSALGFGCGAVGGLMVRGDPGDQERAIACALDAGVNYFDTARQYGNGESERNLGRVLRKLKPANAVVGTKVRLLSNELNRIDDAVRR